MTVCETMSTEFKKVKAHCKVHNLDFVKYIKVKVSCPRYEQCRKEAIKRHEANITEAMKIAKEKGLLGGPAKAICQIVCSEEVPEKTIP